MSEREWVERETKATTKASGKEKDNRVREKWIKKRYRPLNIFTPSEPLNTVHKSDPIFINHFNIVSNKC